MCKSVDNNWYLQGGVSTKMLVSDELSGRSEQLHIRQKPRGDADPLLNTQGWMGLLLCWGATFGSIRLLVARLFRQIPGRLRSPENSGVLRLVLSPISPRILVVAFRRSFVPGSPWNRRRC